MRIIASSILVATMLLSLSCIGRVYGNPSYDVIILVDPDIQAGIQNSLTQYEADLEVEGWSYHQYDATVEEMSNEASYFRSLLQNYLRDHSIKGAVFVGDFPSAQ